MQPNPWMNTTVVAGKGTSLSGGATNESERP